MRKEQERKSASRAARSRAARSREGEKKRKLSQASPSMTSVSIQEQLLDNKQSVMVNGERIFLNSSNPELTAIARKVLVDHLSTLSSLPDSSPPSYMKYSRTDILTLATSPLSREAPLNLDKLVPYPYPSPSICHPPESTID